MVGFADDLRAGILEVPWVWQDGTLAQLPELVEGVGSAALAINQAGDIVGYSNGRAVIWRRKGP